MNLWDEIATEALDRWGFNPCLWAMDMFGCELWSGQARLLDSYAHHRHVSCVSGHKTGKTRTLALGALWFVLFRTNARIVLTAPSFPQIRDMIWDEITTLHPKAAIPLGGRVYNDPHDGIVWPDERRIYGITADTKPETFAGRSGENLLYSVDEASGVPDKIHAVCATNPSGTTIMVGNPTKNSGAFYRSHNEERDYWHCLHLSSDDAAAENPLIDGRRKFPGLATDEWCARERAKEGAGSYFDLVRIQGCFPTDGANMIVTPHMWTCATQRAGQGGPVLSIGLDPARYGDDEIVFTGVRGDTLLGQMVFRKLSGKQIAQKLLEILELWRIGPREPAIVKIDGNGNGSAAVEACLELDLEYVEIVSLDSMQSPTTTNDDGETGEHMKSERFERMRDQLAWSSRVWLLTGSIAANQDTRELLAELKERTFEFRANKIRVETKDEVKKRLKRSPDRADSFNLACLNVGGGGSGFSVVNHRAR